MIINFFKINEEELEKQIICYADFHGTDPKYLIMSKGTLELIKAITKTEQVFKKYKDKGKFDLYYGSYWGIPIAVCNKLKDGEVDII